MHHIPPSAQNTLPELRCQHCGKKLAEGYVDLLVIKCPRCRTIGKGFSLLPTPTVHALRGNYLCYLRSRQTWATTTNLGTYLLGLAYGLTGQEKIRLPKHFLDP